MSAAEYAQLVEYLGRQFAVIDRRFDAVDRRFDAIEQKLSDEVGGLRRKMLGHFDEIYRRLERLEQEYVAITQALRRIEARLDHEAARREILERDVAELKRQTAQLQIRVEAIERRLNM